MDKKVISTILAKTGYALLDVQATEKAIKLCAKVALPRLELLLTGLGERLNNDEYDRKTIGQMLKQLRARVTFQQDFEDILGRFLMSRNLLAHHLENVPGWNLKTKKGVIAANTFLNELLDDSKLVRSVFVGIVKSWCIQSGMALDDEEFSKVEIPESLQTPILQDAYLQKNA